MTPALKSIQPGFFSKSRVLDEILTVGTGDENGVPRPVVKSTSCAPDEARAVAATISFPGAERRFRPLFITGSEYLRTPSTSLFPAF